MNIQTLNRETFTLSRELEFFQERELSAQIGLIREYWPLVILKELLDNALDACETANIPPEIVVKLEILNTIHRDEDCHFCHIALTVSDNGPGLRSSVVNRILDFKTRTSDKEAYRSPSRGQQGNALKTILAIPFIESDNKEGHIAIESQGIRHDIRIQIDTIRQKPIIEHEKSKIVKSGGCAVTVYTSINLDYYMPTFLQIIANYICFNPHLTIRAEGLVDMTVADCATNPTWRKWIPSDPTSAHWYGNDDFTRLVSAYIAKSRYGGRDYTIREFVSQFRGLSSTRKQKAITDKLSGVRRLSDLVNGNGLEAEKAAVILHLMKQETKPVPPEYLGIIGEAHFKAVLETEDIKYHCYRHKGEVPFVVEAAFAYDAELESPRYIFGLNFAPTLSDSIGVDTQLPAKYRQGWKYGWGIKGLAREFKLKSDDAACLIVHIAHPRLIFQDRGKTHIAPDGDLRRGLGKVIGEVLKEHCATSNKLNKELDAQERQRREAEKISKSWIPSLREAVFTVMAEAANKASGGGTLPYSVRQLYYQVRPLIQQYTDKELEYAYFTPPLVTEYEEEYGPLQGLIYDARGHLYEPHNGTEVALGTIDVANYQIPEWEYDKILYIEKEGFRAIFEAADLGRRYDMAIMTAKGFATRAAKQLLARATGREITILAAHDADVSGYEIARTLAEETRTSRGLDINVIDIGLKVEEALALGLEKERVRVKRQLPKALCQHLTDSEYDFLRQYRIELNTMTTDQLISWIESKLAENDLKTKVIPPDGILSANIREQLSILIEERATKAVSDALEKILGVGLIYLGDCVSANIEKPDTDGYCYDLRDSMSDCPIIHWRLWAERKAQTLAGIATKDVDALAERIIRERLNNGPANSHS